MKNKAFSKKILCLVVIGSLMSSTLAYAESSTLIVTQPINNSAALTKDETVFATLDSTGAPKSTSVTSWIHSDSMLPELKDKSNLSNIKNLKGSETPTKNGDSLVWKTDKNDIFYSGDSNKTLPIGIKIVYYLNDKEISAKDLAGKSGKVKIKIDFDNKTKKMVNVNGKARTVCESIPITTVINMPVGNFSKIVATDGTIMKVGNNNVLTFISVPGFQESLGLKNGDLGVTLANSVVVTAEAKDFKLAPIYFAASPDLLDLENIAGGPSVFGDLTAKLSGAKAGISKLANGTSQLAAGAKELNSGIQSQLKPGVSGLVAGVKLLDTGINTTAKGSDGKPLGLVAATDVLYNNILQVNGVVNGVKDANGRLILNANGKPVNKGFNTYIQEILTAVTTEAGYAKGDPANSNPVGLRGGLLATQEGVNTLIDNTKKLVGAAQKDPILALALLRHGLADPKDPTGAKTLALLNKLQEGMGKLVSNTALSVPANTIDPNAAVTLADALTVYKNGMGMFATQAQAGLPDAAKFDKSVHELGNKVHSELLPGTQQLNEGVTKLAANTPALAAGTQELNTGVSSLTGKIAPLTTKLDDVLAAKDEMVKIAKENPSFSGVDPSMKGSLKFVMQTGDIKVDDSGTKKGLKTEKKSFWDKVYDAFIK